MKKRFQITIDDISKLGKWILISGKANSPLYKGKLGDLVVLPVRPEPLILDRAILNVISGDVSKIKIGQTLYGDWFDE